MVDNPFDHNDGHLILSYELLYLLQWLVDHEPEALKEIITRAVKKGFKQPFTITNDFVELQVSDTNIQQSIIEFLALMDTLLIESSAEESINKNIQRTLIPALNRIDSTICDDETVQTSLERASSTIEHHPEQNPQDVLLKELLKRWKPDKKTLLN